MIPFEVGEYGLHGMVVRYTEHVTLQKLRHYHFIHSVADVGQVLVGYMTTTAFIQPVIDEVVSDMIIGVECRHDSYHGFTGTRHPRRDYSIEIKLVVSQIHTGDLGLFATFE